jgi:hypothetical protein
VSPTLEFVNTPDGRWVGGRGGEYIPQAASIVKLRTAKRGRSYRGRIFLPFLPEGGQNNGTLNAGDVAQAQTAWDDFVVDIAGNDCSLVVASYKHQTAEVVTTVLVEGEAATQRRRQSRNR